MSLLYKFYFLLSKQINLLDEKTFLSSLQTSLLYKFYFLLSKQINLLYKKTF